MESNRSEPECPRTFGDAKVIAYARVGPENTHTGNTKQMVSGKLMGPATMMLVAKYEGDNGYYLFGTYGEDSNSGTDTWHQDLEDAIEQMDFEYEGLSSNLVWYEKPADFNWPQ